MITCNRCVMDQTASPIEFNEKGECNYCSEFLVEQAKINFSDKHLSSLLEKIKTNGKSKRYDCIIGVSGGVDSSYVLSLAVGYGLRPLAVHLDNGWNSDLAVANINNLISKLGVDLYTHVIDWEEYRALMQAFFDADVIDIELLYDNAMLAVNFQQAAKFGLHYMLSGSNTTSEGMIMPRDWHAFKFDKKNRT